MSQKLLDHSLDLQRLVEEGYELELRGAYALVHHIPYVNQTANIAYGTLVSPLTLSGNTTVRPNTHVIYFIGEHPCDKTGNKMFCISHQTANIRLAEGLTVNHAFSNKPSGGYTNYYEKFVQYIKIISAPAVALDRTVTAQTYRNVMEEHETVFQYIDTNSGRASIVAIGEKLAKQNIGIIGLGGSGSYILDLVSKCPVRSIHLYDGDRFYQHNAFRAPGAASIEEIEKCEAKVEYFAKKYSNMHKNIIAHNRFIDEENLALLNTLDFVFLCVDKGDVKKLIIEGLLQNEIPFIDSGIGITSAEDMLLGQIRSTLISVNSQKGLKTIDMSADNEEDDAYKSNIQIAELNALNACLSVIRWKKYFGFYQDVREYTTDVYSINDGELYHENETI